MKRTISCLLVLTLLGSAMLFGSFSFQAFAASTDNFSWSFEDNQPTVQVKNIAADTQNVTGTGTKYYKFIGEQHDLAPDVGFGPGITGGSGDQNDTESKKRILDGSPSTKWLSPTGPHWVSFEMAAPITPKFYYITSANDATDRDPTSWVLEGSSSKDGPWTVIDTQTNQGVRFAAGRFLTIPYTVPEANRVPYKHFRLNNIGRSGGGNGMMQFAEFCFFDQMQEFGFDGQTDYLYPQIGAGPAAIWDSSTSPWSGASVLIVNGKSTASASETVSSKSYTTILDNLSIDVYADTKLSYMISPEGVSTSGGTNNYDYKFTSHHMAIDLKFSDGTRLKNLGATDQYGYGLNPRAQGESKVLGTCMWNYVLSDLGKVAAGKTITEIIVGFEMPDCTPDYKAKAVFDDIKIFRETIDLNAIELADFVDIRQGTNVSSYASGALMPMAAVPNPFNMWAPSTNRSGANKYSYVNDGLKSITISHVASRHMGERGSYAFMSDAVTVPTGTEAEINTAVNNAVNNSNGKFQHANEIAHNYHYGVTFDSNDARNPGVKLEVTPTVHAAVLRFTFPAGAAARNVLFNSPDSTNNNYSNMTPVGDGKTFNAWMQSGNNGSGGSTGMKRMYVYGEFSAVPSNFYVPSTGNTRSLASFPNLANGPNGSTVIELKVASSFISAEQALSNLGLEIAPTENFDAVCAKAKATWNTLLSSVKIEDDTANYSRLSDFYTKLARSQLYPTVLSENTGTNAAPVWKYSSPYGGTNQAPDIQNGFFIYNEGWWDTYRSKWTLLSFLRPKAAGLLLDGVVQHFIDNNGRGSFAIPRWVNPGGSNMMVGTSSDAIIADAYMRGVNFDYQNGYLSAIKSSSVYSTSSANGGRNGLQTSIFLGYTAFGSAAPAGGGGQLDTSWALEGFLNDGALSKMALKMRNEKTAGTSEWKKLNDEYLYFLNRSKYFVNQFNPAKGGWMRNRNASGAWTETDANFNPLAWGNGFCEDNAFPYSVLAPQDGQGLANLYGGKEALGVKMDDIFTNNGDYYGGGYGGWIHEGIEKREVKMGQVAVSNQTSYHLPYMYLFTDRPWNTQKYIRELVRRTFSGEAIGRGYLGEEDNGAYASWYVLSSLGFYPLDQGSGQVVIGSPYFKKTTVTTDAGDVYTITAPNNSLENVYIKSMKIDGQPYNKLYIDQSQFHNGMTIEFEMSPTPTTFGTAAGSAPPSVTQGDGPEKTPDIMMDLTVAGAPAAAMPVATSTTNAAFAPDATDGANLFNNDSANFATFGARTADIYYYFAKGAIINMYTITSSNTANADPTAWVLYGSNDGDAASPTWVALDSRSGETFQWRRYTRPFALTNSTRYKYYRLSISDTVADNLSLAQFELLGDTYAFIDKSDLLAKITAAQAIDSTLYGPDEYPELLAMIAYGQGVYDDPNAAGKQISLAIDKIQGAIDALIAVRKAYVPFDAADYNDGTSSAIKKESSTPTTGSDIPLTTISNIGGSFNGAIVAFKYIDFGNGEADYTRARATYAGNTTDCNGAHMRVHLDSPDGPVIADINTPPTAEGTSWSVYKYGYGEITNKAVYGLHNVYIELLNGGGNHVANVYQFVFESNTVTPPDFVVDPVVTEENGVTKIDAKVRNNTDAAKTVSLIAAVYESNGQLSRCERITADVASKTWKTFDTLAIDLTGVGAGYSIKLFAWDPAFVPLTAPLTIK